MILSMWRKHAAVAAMLLVSSCAGKLDYAPPSLSPNQSNAVVVNKPLDTVWREMVPALGQRFFVINNIDRASGLINVSYSGDPNVYVDCGTVSSYVKNARGERTYTFPGAKAHQTYEVMEDALYFIDRQMSLEGRMNLIFQEISSAETRVTANTRYVLTRSQRITSTAQAAPMMFSHTINLNSGQQVSFPAVGKAVLTCVPTGRFESEVLGLVK